LSGSLIAFRIRTPGIRIRAFLAQSFAEALLQAAWIAGAFTDDTALVPAVQPSDEIAKAVEGSWTEGSRHDLACRYKGVVRITVRIRVRERNGRLNLSDETCYARQASPALA
jgi:hypothetical protein